MKMTVILDNSGELVAAHAGEAKRDGKEAGVFAGPGQKLHEIDVPEHVASTEDPARFLESIRPHLPKA